MIDLEKNEFSSFRAILKAEGNALLDEMERTGAAEGEITIKIGVSVSDHDKQIGPGGVVLDTWVPHIEWMMKSAAKIKHEPVEGEILQEGYLTKKGAGWEITDADELVLIHD